MAAGAAGVARSARETAPLRRTSNSRPRAVDSLKCGACLSIGWPSAGLGDYFSALPKRPRFRVGAPDWPLHRPSRSLLRAKGPQAAHIPPGAAPRRPICVEQAQAKGERQHARSSHGRKNPTLRRAGRPERPPRCMDPPRCAGASVAAQEGRHDTIWWSSAATRRRASHPLPLIVTRELGAAQRTQRGPSRVVACSPRASGPAASDRTARERRLGCCGERRWLRVGPRSAHAPSSSPHQPPSAPALLLSLSSPAARAAADERDRTCRPRR